VKRCNLNKAQFARLGTINEDGTIHMAARPQNEPNAIQHGTIGFATAARTGYLDLFGKVLFCDAPHGTWHAMVFDVLGFCDMLFHDVSCFVKVRVNPTYNGIRHFLQPSSIFG
jgi:hypothetical protein